MSRSVLHVALILGAGFFLLSFPAVRAATSEVQRVIVTNFPELQRIAGSVAVEGTVRHASFVSIKDVRVPPVDPKETGRLIDAGVVATDGFTAVVLSLSGQTQGKVLKSGMVGAILVPEEETITAAFGAICRSFGSSVSALPSGSR